MIDLLLILLRITTCATSADLVAPFELDSDRKIGFWEFGGSTVIQQNVIMLAPPVQYNFGYAWTNVEIPKGSWTLNCKMQIHSGTGGGGFGLWFVDSYGASGALHGGPTEFNGLGVVVSLKKNDVANADDTFNLQFHILQSGPQSRSSFNVNTLSLPDGTVPLDRNVPFSIKCELDNNVIKVFFSQKEGQKGEKVCEKKITVDISDNFVGITARSDAFTSRFDLFSIGFKLGISEKDNAHSGKSNQEPKSKTVSFGKDAPSGHYTPDSQKVLRNPSFEITLSELEAYLKQGNEATKEADFKTLYGMITEMNQATYDVASFKELNSFVTQTILPYSQKWHARTLKLVERVQEARNVMGAAWNYTHEMIQNMNSTMRMNTVKTTFKVIDLAEMIQSEADAAAEGTELGAEQSTVVKIMVNGAIIEFVALVIFFILIQFSAVKDKVFGPSI